MFKNIIFNGIISIHIIEKQYKIKKFSQYQFFRTFFLFNNFILFYKNSPQPSLNFTEYYNNVNKISQEIQLMKIRIIYYRVPYSNNIIQIFPSRKEGDKPRFKLESLRIWITVERFGLCLAISTAFAALRAAIVHRPTILYFTSGGNLRPSMVKVTWRAPLSS